MVGAQLLQRCVSLLRAAQVCLQVAGQLAQPAQPGVLALQVPMQAAGCVLQNLVCRIRDSVKLCGCCQVLVSAVPAHQP